MVENVSFLDGEYCIDIDRLRYGMICPSLNSLTNLLDLRIEVFWRSPKEE